MEKPETGSSAYSPAQTRVPYQLVSPIGAGQFPDAPLTDRSEHIGDLYE